MMMISKSGGKTSFGKLINVLPKSFCIRTCKPWFHVKIKLFAQNHI